VESGKDYELDLMDLVVEFISTIKRRFILIIIITLIAVSIGSVFNLYIAKPVYEARANIIIGTTSDEKSAEESHIVDPYTYQRLTKTYSFIAKTVNIAQKTIDILGLKISPQELQQRMTVMPEEDSQLLYIKIQGDSYEQVKNIVNTFSSVFIEEARGFYPTVNIRLIDKIDIPELPIKPNKRLNLEVSLLIGIIVSISIALFIEYLNPSIKRKIGIERYLGAPVIGTIPKAKKNIENINLHNTTKSHQVFMEAYRTLRTNIDFTSTHKNFKTIVVTSCMSGEGKTTTAYMLANLFAQMGKMTILVDCDFRKSNIDKLFSLNAMNGLSDMLTSNIKLEQVVQKCDVDNLYLLAAGTESQNPAEILSMSKLRKLLNKLREEYDYVIIDTPPVGLVTDAQLISQLADGCLMVVDPKLSKKKMLLRAKELLQHVNTSILGISLNKTVDFENHKLINYFDTKKERKNKKLNKQLRSKRSVVLNDDV
jgi:polysaccharide biosynthesis transport protein